MQPLPISTFEDMQELSRAFDRIKNAESNKRLQIARKSAEVFYKNGKPEIGARILNISGKFFINNRKEIL
jgi:hypothetical protein